MLFCFFFFTDPANTEIYTLSLHDALPIYSRPLFELPSAWRSCPCTASDIPGRQTAGAGHCRRCSDRKSTRLNSSHVAISYAVFCLKKKKKRHSTKTSSWQYGVLHNPDRPG